MAKNKDTDVLAEEELDAAPRVYELGFHIDPELPTEEVKKVYQAVRALLSEKGSVVAEVEPEKIPLAYTISRQEVGGRRDFDSAYFAWIVYETTGVAHAEVIAAARANTALVRFIDLITTKEAARHAIEVHELSLKASAPADMDAGTDEALNTEIDAALENAAV